MPETREAIKKKMFPIIIGIMLVFGATSIASFIISVNGG
jgi:type IV secretory pathway VirB2 component (pilin)